MFALGNVQISKGNSIAAFETHSQVLHLFKNSLGIRHHRTADICHKLGWHFNQSRNYSAAMYALFSNPSFLRVLMCCSCDAGAGLDYL